MNVKVSAWLFPIVLTMSMIMQMEDVNVGIQKLLKSVIWSEVLKNQVLVLIVSTDHKNSLFWSNIKIKTFFSKYDVVYYICLSHCFISIRMVNKQVYSHISAPRPLGAL